ncbi:head-tail connector protein [Kingella kingae]|uniref:head-tail connector protein n=1 Tax=Kingella kingae TaxID=504 RepID=UPI00254DF8A8|nr:head-tail connector protein [Kingella kingae]MDK4586940.1 head-tail connector protein [Kingella kingae]MDK4630782.1 head-tail connector protein [Kingella kingae]MDK4657131.1 head-tail connector protein [Kingella kingae]
MNYETLLPLNIVKVHLRIDDANLPEDNALVIYRDAACNRIKQYLNIDNGDVQAAFAHSDIQAAALILIAHLYENREGGDMARTDELPAGFYALLMPHRLDLGV